MTEPLIGVIAAAALMGAAAGFLVGMIYVTWRDVTRLERELTDTRRTVQSWRRGSEGWEATANMWRNRARLATEMHRVERKILGIEPLPEEPEPHLSLVDGEAN